MSEVAAAERLGATGTDAERRGARALADELRATGRRARLVPVWVRPAWWLVQALCASAGVAASVLAVDHPPAGLLLALAALALAALDLTRLQPLRRLTIARATQNVVSPPPEAGGEQPVTLVVTAAAHLPRRGLAARAPGGAMRWSLLALALVAACAGARLAGADGPWIGAVQLVPTVALLALVFAFVEEGVTRPRADESATRAALEVVRALDAEPPERLGVAVVLAGGDDVQAAGLREWLRTRRARGLRPAQLALLHIEPCAAGAPVWWERDGILVRAALHPQLCAAAATVAAARPELGARPRRRGPGSAAGVARAGGWPAIAVGALADRGEVTPTEAPRGVDATAAFAVALARELDAALGRD